MARNARDTHKNTDTTDSTLKPNQVPAKYKMWLTAFGEGISGASMYPLEGSDLREESYEQFIEKADGKRVVAIAAAKLVRDCDEKDCTVMPSNVIITQGLHGDILDQEPEWLVKAPYAAAFNPTKSLADYAKNIGASDIVENGPRGR